MSHYKIEELTTYGAIGAVAAVVFVILGLLAVQGRPTDGLPGAQSSGSVMHYLFTHPKN